MAWCQPPRVELDPTWYHAASTFVKSGFDHILDGPDRLLFLLCLLLPFRRLDWYLVGVVTSFTIAHSITLIAAAYGIVPAGVWFPPLVEALIAASIVYMAIENVIRPDLGRRWFAAGFFGLIHGFGFSFLLQSKLQFAGSHLLLSLLAFNVGIELGQLLVIVLVVPLLALLHRLSWVSDRLLIIIVSVLVGHTAWHWLTERLDALRKVDWSIEPMSVATAAAALIAIVVVGGLAWAAFKAGGSRRRALALHQKSTRG